MNSTNPWNTLSYPRLCALAADKPTRLSQAMHNAAFKALNLPFTYVAFDTTDTTAVVAAVRKLGIRGFSLTIPHKEAAMTLVDRLSPEAEAIGAINTLVNNARELTGYNTDCYGIEQALKEASFDSTDSRVLIIGAGGAARAAAYTLKTLGSQSILIVNRNTDRAKQLAEHFGLEHTEYANLSTLALTDYDLIINSTPIGSHLEREEIIPLDTSVLGPNICVFDFVTQETPLLRLAIEANAKSIAGSRMLLHQAARQFELFTTETPPLKTMEQALSQALKR